MAHVFLSYDREDAGKARSIAVALEKAGHSVWWDLHIKGGAEYGTAIEQALADADAVVVLWSQQSVDSAWVRDEAAAGRDNGRLIPILLDPVSPPMGFRQYQSLNFSSWKGRGKPPHLADLLESIEALGGRPSAERPPTEPRMLSRNPKVPRHSLLRWAVVVSAVIGLILAISILIRPNGGSTPTVAVTPAHQSQEAQTLARDLFVRLGALPTQNADRVQLVDENTRKAPDLILEVSGSASGTQPAASLVLLRGKDRQLLYSQNLAAPKGETADLKTSLAVAATGALDCTTKALASRAPLRLNILKQYLGACARFGALYGMEDVSILIPQLEQVVQREPHFLPARRQLLLAGAFMRSIPTEVTKPSEQWLRNQIHAARRIEPAMPELRLAEVELLPTNDFAGRISLLDKLREAHPDDMFVLGTRAEQLMLVGRNNEAVVDAERAARLDPLAPYARSEYIRALTFSGRVSRAVEELKEFVPISPVAMNLTDAKFRVSLRYSDPQPALRILRMYGTSKAHDAFLIARIEPTQANIARAIALARSIATERGLYSTPAEVLSAYGYDDEVFQMLIRVPAHRTDQVTLQTLFRPTLRNLRQNPRFLGVAQHFGLLKYWQQSGKWPDFCFEPGLPYDCKAEATKLS